MDGSPLFCLCKFIFSTVTLREEAALLRSRLGLADGCEWLVDGQG